MTSKNDARHIPASVFFCIEGRVARSAGKKRWRPEEYVDWPPTCGNLTARLEVFADEDHAGVFLFLLTHALRAYLKKVAVRRRSFAMNWTPIAKKPNPR